MVFITIWQFFKEENLQQNIFFFKKLCFFLVNFAKKMIDEDIGYTKRRWI